MSETRSALVVEDDEGVREVLIRICSWLEIEVQVASDGNEGIEALERTSFDLVITDLRMPGASGLDIARRTHGLSPRPAVVVISGFVTPDDEDNIVFAGAKLLRKPFDAQNARATIEEAMRARG